MSEQVVIALIASGGTIVAGFLALLGIKIQVGRVRRRRQSEESPDVDDELIVKYENDPRKFVEDVLQDNARKATQLGKQDERIQEMREELTRMWETMTELRTELDRQKRDETRFRDALGRWLAELFNSWGKVSEMPWPHENDAAVLQSVLPRR